MKKSLLIVFLAFSLLSCTKSFDVPNDLNLNKNASHFTGGSFKKPYPKIRLLKDELNHKIAKMCINSATIKDLKKLNIEDLSHRLNILTEGNVLISTDKKYRLSFPVIVGENRKAMADIVTKAAEELSPFVESMINKLNLELKGNEHILFHILWSRVIDEVWFDAFNLSFPEEKPPKVIWVMYPEHPFAVGTNYNSLPGHGNLALTWSNNFTEHLAALDELRFELHQAAWDKEITNIQAKEKMREFGAFDMNDRFSVFSYKRSDKLDQILTILTKEYALEVSKIYDYIALSEKFDIPYDELFVIVLHETAYAVFERLHKSGKLQIPEILLHEDSKKNSIQLASLELDQPPSLTDEAMALFMKSGWHGNEEVIKKFKEVLNQTPDNLEILWYLGLSLYDVKMYSESIDVFKRLLNLTNHNKDKLWRYDWSQIWIGHIYDVLGEREKALSYYRNVLNSKHDSGNLMMGQYNEKIVHFSLPFFLNLTSIFSFCKLRERPIN